MRYKCICSYDGTFFHGFQIQKNLRTVQEEIEKALQFINKSAIRIHPSGRTDGGVHALNQVFHFDMEIKIEPEALRRALNSRLPEDIYLKSIIPVGDNFHARYDVISKEYHYLIDFGEYNPFKRNYRYFCRFKNIDIELFKKALMIFIGKHDFRSFTKNQALSNTIREIYDLSFETKDKVLKIKIRGDGFMHHMVRILIAMALEVARGKISISELKLILARKDRRLSPKIVPPQGLYLYFVYYD